MRLARSLRYVDGYKCRPDAGGFLPVAALKLLRRGILLMGMLGCFAVLADEEGGVVTELVAEVRESVRTPEGGESHRFVPATLLTQGQIVYYTVRIENPTPATLSDIEVTQRVPANTTYVPGSASGPGADIYLSTDSQNFESEAARESSVAGRVESQNVEYTHIRWRLRYPLAPGAVALARFRAVFD